MALVVQVPVVRVAQAQVAQAVQVPVAHHVQVAQAHLVQASPQAHHVQASVLALVQVPQALRAPVSHAQPAVAQLAVAATHRVPLVPSVRVARAVQARLVSQSVQSAKSSNSGITLQASVVQ